MIKSLLLPIAVVSAVATSVSAQDIRLQYSDIDVSQNSGAQRLAQRIDAQAKAWCSQQITTGTMLPDPQCVPTVSKAVVTSLPKATRDAYVAALKVETRQVASHDPD